MQPKSGYIHFTRLGIDKGSSYLTSAGVYDNITENQSGGGRAIVCLPPSVEMEYLKLEVQRNSSHHKTYAVRVQRLNRMVSGLHVLRRQWVWPGQEC